jgi:DNA-binding transcriptional MerR regulator
MAYTVGQVAEIAHVSVRALHHYDELGLLEPSGRSEAGYRLYDDADLERLQEVLFYRELGFSLEEIGELLRDPAIDRRAALLMQRELLAGEAQRLRAMIETLDKTLDATTRGVQMDKEEMFEVFGDFDPSEHEDEVRERWGDSDAYAESARRTARYGREDWVRFKTQSGEVNEAIAALMDEGVPPDHPRAMDAVERARLQIDEWFYPCSREMHAELGRMYVSDPRFTETYERIRPGMARYVCDATAANLAREGSVG